MKKIISYREKLLELANIYKIAEVRSYAKNKKYLTTPQLEHILKKNKVPIPTEINKSLLEIQVKKISKPVFSTGNKIGDFFSSVIYGIVRFFISIGRTIKNFFISIYDGILNIFFSIFKGIINFILAIKNGIINLCIFISKGTVNLLNSIYNFQVHEKKANRFVTIVVSFAFLSVVSVGGFYIKDIISGTDIKNVFLEKKSEVKTPKEKVAKVPEKKPKIKKTEEKVAKAQKQKKKDPEIVSEFTLPNLNLKTETVLSLFKDVQYDLRTVRNEKKVKPIYFTQFPKDLDEIKSVKLKKETFIKIVLPLVVAENQKIILDRITLDKVLPRKEKSEKEKLWLRQKYKEYKVANNDSSELKRRMDIIPISIALAQAAKESGWGTSRFALEGNAIFGQWTWSGKGIAPLNRDNKESHKILRFPILRASVKAYKNNLNTHNGYKEFRVKRSKLRSKNKKIAGLSLIHTLENYAQTGKEYTKILEQIIEENSLTDFENVLLTDSVIKKQLNL